MKNFTKIFKKYIVFYLIYPHQEYSKIFFKYLFSNVSNFFTITLIHSKTH